MAGFGDMVLQGCDQVLREISKKCYSITWQLFTTVVQATPVLKGHLINSWYPQAGRDFSSQVATNYNKSGSDSLSRINALSKSNEFYKRNGAMTMTNNLDYGRRIEYEGWSKHKAPAGMVRVSLVKVAGTYRNIP